MPRKVGHSLNPPPQSKSVSDSATSSKKSSSTLSHTYLQNPTNKIEVFFKINTLFKAIVEAASLYKPIKFLKKPFQVLEMAKMSWATLCFCKPIVSAGYSSLIVKITRKKPGLKPQIIKRIKRQQTKALKKENAKLGIYPSPKIKLSFIAKFKNNLLNTEKVLLILNIFSQSTGFILFAGKSEFLKKAFLSLTVGAHPVSINSHEASSSFLSDEAAEQMKTTLILATLAISVLSSVKTVQTIRRSQSKVIEAESSQVEEFKKLKKLSTTKLIGNAVEILKSFLSLTTRAPLHAFVFLPSPSSLAKHPLSITGASMGLLSVYQSS